jgi:hypothetical protein
MPAGGVGAAPRVGFQEAGVRVAEARRVLVAPGPASAGRRVQEQRAGVPVEVVWGAPEQEEALEAVPRAVRRPGVREKVRPVRRAT